MPAQITKPNDSYAWADYKAQQKTMPHKDITTDRLGEAWLRVEGVHLLTKMRFAEYYLNEINIWHMHSSAYD